MRVREGERERKRGEIEVVNVMSWERKKVSKGGENVEPKTITNIIITTHFLLLLLWPFVSGPSQFPGLWLAKNCQKIETKPSK